MLVASGLNRLDVEIAASRRIVENGLLDWAMRAPSLRGLDTAHSGCESALMDRPDGVAKADSLICRSMVSAAGDFRDRVAVRIEIRETAEIENQRRRIQQAAPAARFFGGQTLASVTRYNLDRCVAACCMAGLTEVESGWSQFNEIDAKYRFDASFAESRATKIDQPRLSSHRAHEVPRETQQHVLNVPRRARDLNQPRQSLSLPGHGT